MDVARWIAADRGAFEEPEIVRREAVEPLPIMARLTCEELVLIWAFRETLPCLE